jgi:hypothetical protein
MNGKLLPLSLVLALGVSACATSPRQIETPTGPVLGTVTGPFVVLGVADKATGTLNRPNGANDFIETVHVDAPLGTTVIVPVLRGWELGYGSTSPANLTQQPLPESTFTWSSADHHFGIGNVNVAVIDIDAAAPGATTQSATVQVAARLNDDNGDDPWWGVIRYELIFLGPATGR